MPAMGGLHNVITSDRSPPEPMSPAKPPTAPKPKPKPSKPASGEAGPCIVVGYDGSPEARHAALWAAHRAGPGGRLVLINASRPADRWWPVGMLIGFAGRILQIGPLRTDRGRALIGELSMDADDALLDVPTEAHVVDKTPADALLESARSHGADEIVVGSHHSSRARALYGDVAAELVGRASVPVSVIPLGETPAPASPAAPRGRK